MRAGGEDVEEFQNLRDSEHQVEHAEDGVGNEVDERELGGELEHDVHVVKVVEDVAAQEGG